jgi:hypothetical protein
MEDAADSGTRPQDAAADVPMGNEGSSGGDAGSDGAGD